LIRRLGGLHHKNRREYALWREASFKDAGKFAAWSERPVKSATWTPAGGESSVIEWSVDSSGLVMVELPKSGRRRPGEILFVFSGH